MQIIVKMRVEPGDTHVSKATIKMYDKNGVDLGGQVLLEGETAETNLMIPKDGYCQIREMERPVTVDIEQKQTVYADLTPKDPLTNPDKPTVTPQAKHEPKHDEKVSSYKK